MAIYINGKNVGIVVDTAARGEDEEQAKHLVQVIDYDGTVLKSARLNTGATFALPVEPSHDKLVFQGWSSPVEITDNKVTIGDSDITIGATYETASGKTEFDITLTKATGLTFTMQNLTGMTSVEWGDGKTDAELTHTYENYGDYTISVSGVTELGSYIFSPDSTASYGCTKARLGSSVKSVAGSFPYCRNLTSVTIPSSVTLIGKWAFYGCVCLTSITFPSSVTSFGAYIIGATPIVSVVIPNGIKTLTERFLYGCESLTSITIPNSVTSIGSSAFEGCSGLTSIIIPSSVTSIGSSAFSGCSGLTGVTIPSSVKTIGERAFASCQFTTATIKSSAITTIGEYAFNGCYPTLRYDFTAATVVPTLAATSAFNGINRLCKIVVPDSLYDEWIAATNWAHFANYIYKASEV